MARDIEEFLRRAAERRQKAQQRGGAQRPPQQRPAPPRPAAPPLRQAVDASDVVAEVGEALPSQKTIRDESVAEHVRRHIDVSDIVDHVDQLAEDVEQADERMEAHLDQVSDHNVGKLSSEKGATDELLGSQKSNELAENLLAMLGNPKSVQQSILVAEILKRPDFDEG